jgi:hypothetical protein
MPKCLITGCDILVIEEQKWCHADLHHVNGAYIANACIENGETMWHYNSMPSYSNRVITIVGDYFERRGVIVFTYFVPNENAEKYMENSHD